MKLNKHNMSMPYFWTASLGILYPTDIIPILPCDKMMKRTDHFIRCSPLVAPAFAGIKQHTHHWYVPTFLLWDDFEDFITGNDESLRQPKVKFSKTQCKQGTLWDYFGLPTEKNGLTVDIDFKVDALPFKAFWFIWDVYYRDQDLQPDTDYETMGALVDKWIAGTASEDDLKKVLTLPRVSWRKDIYTTARPWQQKGSEVVIPLDIKGDGPLKFGVADGENYSISPSTVHTGGLPTVVTLQDGISTGDMKYRSGLIAAGLTINKLSQASAMARLKYRDARRGSRYVELLQRMGANPSDGRLFLPQYLGGGKGDVQISEVVQTSENTSTSNLGDLGGHGIGSNKSQTVRRVFNEHGYQITMSFFRPDTMYQNQTERWWFNDIREDYFFKELENTGLQEILTQELYPAAKEDEIFGWNDTYYYYRMRMGRVVGNFKDLEQHWHLAREIKTKPALNSSFIECKPSNRIFADLVNDQFNVETVHRTRMRRLVSKSARLKI